MKFILLMSLLVMLFVGGATFAVEGDPDIYGIVDTLALVPNIDWINNTVELEVYCFTDVTMSGSSIGFTWGNSTADLTMDSAIAEALVTDAYTAGTFLFEDNDINVTNTNSRFLLGGLGFGAGIAGDDGGRRLWATYYFTMTHVLTDCVIFDTLKYSGASANLYNCISGDYSILFAGEVNQCDPTDVNSSFDALPETYALSQNYPNPFNPTTEIKYDIPTKSHTTLKVYNILGQEVETLIDEDKSPGHHSISWDASEYSSGVYFYKITADDFVETKKMVLAK